jgi:hypothetical protein
MEASGIITLCAKKFTFGYLAKTILNLFGDRSPVFVIVCGGSILIDVIVLFIIFYRHYKACQKA